MKREFDELSGRVIAAAIEVHRSLGPGFLEGVYEQALRIELGRREIPFESQKEILVRYEGHVVGRHVLDLFVDEKLVVKLKSVVSFEQVHVAQVKSYLKAMGANVGLLLNFGGTKLDIKRVVLHFEECEPATA
jgi:GxxExxY protein